MLLYNRNKTPQPIHPKPQQITFALSEKQITSLQASRLF